MRMLHIMSRNEMHKSTEYSGLGKKKEYLTGGMYPPAQGDGNDGNTHIYMYIYIRDVSLQTENLSIVPIIVAILHHTQLTIPSLEGISIMFGPLSHQPEPKLFEKRTDGNDFQCPPSILSTACHPLVEEMTERVNDFFLTNWPFPDEARRRAFVAGQYARVACLAFPMANNDRIYLICVLLTIQFLIDGTMALTRIPCRHS